MGFLANAASLLKDQVFKDLITAACAYQARTVMQEADTVNRHLVRLELAREVLAVPNLITERMVVVVATDKSIADQGSDPLAISEDDIVAKVAQAWTKVAIMQYPQITG